MKALPIGISTFRFLIEDDMVYVDKTGIFGPLVRQKGRYFLSRPRRFGKSLLVDTFKELFEGKEELFRELAVHDWWDWSKKYPVIKIDFAGGLLRNEEDFENKLLPVLDRIAEPYGITLSSRGLPNRLGELIQALHQRTGSPVVLLVDEYDKPLLDNIEDRKTAALMRDLLKEFYSPIKEMDGLLQFVFLTGVSKFSKVSIFSGINNLKDISLDPNFADICGYTRPDLESDFAEHLDGVDWEELQRWYDGYSFLGERVYNPFDILLFISENRIYRNFWFETGTPTFLINLLQRERYFLPDLEKIELSDEQMSSFEVERIPPAVLLFQSGYLTIEKSYRKMNKTYYQLRVPNLEVESAFSDSLLGGYTGLFEQRTRYQTGAYEALRSADLPGLEKALRSLFSGIPWRNFTNNDIADYEGYYASVIYAFFLSITCRVIPEDSSNHGQADLTVILDDVVCVTEIKVTDRFDGISTAAGIVEADTNTALEQVRERDYAGKYLGVPGRRVFEAGMVFDRSARNLVSFAWRERGE